METHKGAHTVYYSGMPAQMLEINEFIIEDLRLLIPIVILVVLATLYLSFRNLRGVALPLLTVIIAAVWAVGLMGWLNVEMSAISNIMPIILIAVGTAYGIHVVSKYHEDIHPGAEKQMTIAEALSEVGVPILLAGLTTMIGFLSFIGSYLTAVTDFGVFSAFGIGVAMLIAVLLIPAILMLLRTPTAAAHAMYQEKHFLIGVMDRLGTMVLQHEKLILSAAAALILLTATGIPRITTESNLIQFYPPDSDMWTADELMRERFGGSTPIQMLIDGDLKDPVVLREMLRLGKYMESLPDVNNTQSLADLICEWVRKDNFFAVKTEYYDKGGNLWKVMEQRQLEQRGNYWVAMEIEMTDLKTNHSTKVMTDSLELDTGLSDDIFTQRNLKRVK